MILQAYINNKLILKVLISFVVHSNLDHLKDFTALDKAFFFDIYFIDVGEKHVIMSHIQDRGGSGIYGLSVSINTVSFVYKR